MSSKIKNDYENPELDNNVETQLDLVDWIEEQINVSNSELIGQIKRDGSIGMEDY